MTDIAPVLLEAIQRDFAAKYDADDVIQKVLELVAAGKGTYADANAYAIAVGEILSACYGAHITGSVLPDGKMYFNIADRVLRPTLENNHTLVATETAAIQTNLNKAANIGIKGIAPEINTDRIEGIINKVVAADSFDDVAWMLGEPIVNFIQAIVDDAVHANAEFHLRAGLGPKIVRRSTGHCCAWCDKLAGVYDYKDVRNTGNDVFRRHQRCRCTVEYDPGDGKRQNVHSKEWKTEEELAKIEKRKALMEDPALTEIQRRIDRGEYSLKQSKQSYLKHVEGTPQYEQYKAARAAKGRGPQSQLLITEEEAQQLILRFSGKGMPRITDGGSVAQVEYAESQEFIGKVAGLDGKTRLTKKFAIHHGKKSSHIVPVSKKGE